MPPLSVVFGSLLARARAALRSGGRRSGGAPEERFEVAADETEELVALAKACVAQPGDGAALRRLEAALSRRDSRRRIERIGPGWALDRPPGLAPTKIVAAADAARDAGDPERAARLYAAAVSALPDRDDLYVQLGNMLKDCGRREEAEEVYREAMARRPEDADVRVQLAHLLKLSGRRGEALALYRAAHALDPDDRQTQVELASLGDPRGQARLADRVASGDVEDPTHVLSARLETLAAEIAALRAGLPDAAREAVTPATLYDQFRRRYRTPPPPPVADGAPRFVVFIDADAATLEGLYGLLASLRAQSRRAWRAVAAGQSDPARRVVERAAATDPRLRWFHGPASAVWDDLDADEWAVALRGATRLEPEAFAWLAAARERGPAEALITDDDCATENEDGRVVRSAPALRGAPDFDQILSAGCDAALIAVSGAALRSSPPGPAAERVAHALLGAAMRGRAGHAPLPLASRETTSPRPAPTAQLRERAERFAKQTTAPFSVAVSSRFPDVLDVRWSPGAPQRVAAIVPTRDNGRDVERLVDSLRETAAEPEAVSVLVIDNGSREDETREAFRRLEASPLVGVMRIDEPFNWSRLNNLAAERAQGDILVFVNDDARMLSPDWDRRVVGHLTRSNVGAVGARLLYPDGSVQHAGMLFGHRGLTIHDGYGADAGDPGPDRRWIAPRAVCAVTGAFLATSRSHFERLGGFDAVDLPVGYSDVDYALRIRQDGLRVLYEPHIELVHEESKTRGLDWMSVERAARDRAEARVMRRRWGASLDFDPTVNPHWSDFGRPFQHLRCPSHDTLMRHVGVIEEWRTGARPRRQRRSEDTR